MRAWKKITALLLISVTLSAIPSIGKTLQPVHAQTSALPPTGFWYKTFGEAGDDEAAAVIQTNDGGYVVIGSENSFGAGAYDAWLVKTDSSGNMLWNRTYGGAGDDEASSIIQTSDGGYAIAGYANSSGNGNYHAWLIKTDAAGNMLWNKTYGGANYDYLYSLVQLNDNGYVLAGATSSFGAGANDFWLVRVDSEGNLLWNQTYGGTNYDEAFSMLKSNDSGYALAGTTGSFGAGGQDFWLVKTDPAGVMQWNKTYGGAGDDEAFSIAQANDGGYTFAGLTNSFGSGDYDAWVVKTDSAGNMLWNQTYGGKGYDVVASAVQMSDGGYALAGRTASFGAGGTDAWLVKTDSTGAMLWNQTYGGKSSDATYSVVQTNDGEYALAGTTTSFGAGSFDYYLVKTEGAGPTPYPSPSPASTPTPSSSPSPLSSAGTVIYAALAIVAILIAVFAVVAVLKRKKLAQSLT